MSDDPTTPVVDPNAGQSAVPAQPPVDAADATPNQAIASDALINAPLTPAAPADSAMGQPVPPPAIPDPSAPAVADPDAPVAPVVPPIEEDSDKPADNSATGL